MTWPSTGTKRLQPTVRVERGTRTNRGGVEADRVERRREVQRHAFWVARKKAAP